jgi:hypothetical protein
MQTGCLNAEMTNRSQCFDEAYGKALGTILLGGVLVFILSFPPPKAIRKVGRVFVLYPFINSVGPGRRSSRREGRHHSRQAIRGARPARRSDATALHAAVEFVVTAVFFSHIVWRGSEATETFILFRSSPHSSTASPSC